MENIFPNKQPHGGNGANSKEVIVVYEIGE
jgi:hypothetical protein